MVFIDSLYIHIPHMLYIFDYPSATSSKDMVRGGGESRGCQGVEFGQGRRGEERSGLL